MKPGAVSLMGGVATILNFVFLPSATQFLGFTVAAILFDAAAYFLGYERCCRKGTLDLALILGLSVASAFAAGLVIGYFFMPPVALAGYGGAIVFALIHAAGGAAGGVLGVVLIRGLRQRGLGAGMP
jgi:hypothetical protein